MPDLHSGFGQPADPATIADQLAIIELVGLERLWRDTGEWDKVAEAFTEDAIITTTWFQGNAREFAFKSKEMAQRGRHSKHPIYPIFIRIEGDRALVESRAQIQNRDVFDGVEMDTTQYLRFWSRVVREPVGWRLASFEGIYEKGAMVPVDPNQSAPFEWAEVEAATPRTSYQLWAWAMKRRGYPVPDDRLGDDEPEQLRAFYAGEEAWLNGAE